MAVEKRTAAPMEVKAIPQEELFAKYAKSKRLRKRVDFLFTSTEEHLEELARLHNLQLRKWYHDAPLWMLFLPEDEYTRVMHVGPTMIDGELSLTIAITAYKDDVNNGVRYLMPKAEIIGRIPESVFQQKAESLGTVVRDLVLEGYRTGVNIAEADLTKSVSIRPS